ncbi:M23 family metallopeptidase [Pseudonocardia endophytica]|uniref:Peptidase M23-like protein n=1 Tax=Pseudonocardia endophytica TaxID=401976 RepID=A0A4V2PHF0_PSEEN|nr:M23 family metallopeptidase [Pseudonocardia endophytica]TCK20416.1 peptidase M23-like protein [Pseudonocardia endophytica]
MARHRSPSGAPLDSRHGATPDAPAAGGHRLPAPPPSTRCARITVTAAAGGALVAAGQTFASAFGLTPDPARAAEDAAVARLAASAMLPVNDVSTADPTAPAVTNAIGGEQLTADGSLPTLADTAKVDVANLAKAARLGTEAAKDEGTAKSAMAQGAPQAVVYDGTTYVLPTRGTFTSGFGGRWGVTHYGIDLAAPIGTPIYALTDGVVEKSGPASGFGMWVVLRHTDGTASVYGHVNRSFVEVGQKIKAGDQIAEVGNRGQSTGPHLHLEVWEQDGTKTNPLPWLLQRGINVTGPALAEAEKAA